MGKTRLFIAGFVATMAVGASSQAGGVNLFHTTFDYGDGFVRVQKTSSSTILDEVRMPSFTGLTSCKQDGYRVMRVGTLDAKPYTQTEVSHTWTVPEAALTFSQGPKSATASRKQALADACDAQHAAVRVIMRETGACLCNNSAFCGGDVDVQAHKRMVDVAIECKGFGTPTKKALWLLKYAITVGGQKQNVWRSLALDSAGIAKLESSGYVRSGVDAQIWAGSARGRRALYSFTKGTSEGLLATAAAHPDTIAELEKAGYKKGSVVGYLDEQPGTNSTPLYSYYRSTTKDWVVAAEARSVDAFRNMGYVLQETEGYAITVPNL